MNNSRIVQYVLANLFPSVFAPSAKAVLNLEEQKKFFRIRSIVFDVAAKTGVAPSSINFRICQFDQNACALGNPFSVGGAAVCLAEDYFANFESAKVMSDPEYREWIQWLKILPDHPLEMGKALDFMPLSYRNRIRALSHKFKAVLTKQELEGLIAHELGHAKHFHGLNKFSFIMLYLTATVAVAQAVSPVFEKAVGLTSMVFFPFASGQLQQTLERQADDETAASKQYCEGIKDFFKAATLRDLKSGTSATQQIEAMLGAIDLLSHPNHAKRVVSAIERSNDKERVSSVSILEGAVSLASVGWMAKEVYRIWNELFEKKQKNKA